MDGPGGVRSGEVGGGWEGMEGWKGWRGGKLAGLVRYDCAG
jgi:hypothetical protein